MLHFLPYSCTYGVFKMKKLFLLLVILLFAIGGITMSNTTFKLSSETIKNNETLPNEQVLNAFGCTGGNISPDLKWEGAPAGTKSFALLVHDPDAPRAFGWWHWLIINIPSTINEIKKGEKLAPPAIETITDFNTTGYGGACPPVGHGVHHYNFTIHALDVEKIDADKNTDPNEIEKLVKAHSIAHSTITALYQR